MAIYSAFTICYLKAFSSDTIILQFILSNFSKFRDNISNSAVTNGTTRSILLLETVSNKCPIYSGSLAFLSKKNSSVKNRPAACGSISPLKIVNFSELFNALIMPGPPEHQLL